MATALVWMERFLETAFLQIIVGSVEDVGLAKNTAGPSLLPSPFPFLSLPLLLLPLLSQHDAACGAEGHFCMVVVCPNYSRNVFALRLA